MAELLQMKTPELKAILTDFTGTFPQPEGVDAKDLSMVVVYARDENGEVQGAKCLVLPFIQRPIEHTDCGNLYCCEVGDLTGLRNLLA